MTTNETLAQYSDWAFKSAFTVLVLAFVLLIVQYASARAKAVQDKELVSAGGVDASVPGRVAETQSKSLSERFGGMGRAVLVVGTVLIMSAMFLIVNIVVDLLVSAINPRIRLSQRAS